MGSSNVGHGSDICLLIKIPHKLHFPSFSLSIVSQISDDSRVQPQLVGKRIFTLILKPWIKYLTGNVVSKVDRNSNRIVLIFKWLPKSIFPLLFRKMTPFRSGKISCS